jgi:phosphoglycerate dehydrogenase-like enzyme
MHTQKMLRVGVDETMPSELLPLLPSQVEIVRIPRSPSRPVDVDFWIIAFNTREAAETFKHLRGVKVVQSLLAGVDRILTWLPPGITLCDGRGIHDISTSEWVVAAVLASLKRIPLYAQQQLKGEWIGQGAAPKESTRAMPYRILSEDLADRTVLIVGYGSIGAAIEARLAPFGVNVIRVARTPKQTPQVHAVNELPQLLPHADVVVLIVPLTEETRGMIGAKEIALMKDNALLVNAARGPVVDADALLTALESQRIHAALDVTDPEPLPPGHPLWAAPNCLITPHVAGSTPQYLARGLQFAAAQLRRYLAGDALENQVSTAGY